MDTRKPNEGILLIEDDSDLRETLKNVLEFEGYAVRSASHGQEALEMLSRSPLPRVIILDLMMPIMNGWEFLAQRNLISQLQYIPVIVASAFTKNLPEDANAIIQKPINLDQFLTIVRQLYSEKAA